MPVYGRAVRQFFIFLSLFLLLFGTLVPQVSVQAAASLTVTPITWNVVGLDSNNVNVGPNNFPVGVRVCNTGDVPATNVQADFVWDSANPFINLRSGSLDPISLASLSNISPNNCSDFYFEVEITRNAAAYDTTRRYHISVTADGGISESTITPREIYVEHIVSQSRNSTLDVKLDGTSIAPGGIMAMVVGQTYTITLVAKTATNGYEQIESFINFPNTIFQVLSVDTLYSADTSATVDNPSDMLYGDGCLWVNDPNSPNYRSCVNTGKAGGDITVDYVVKIIGGAGTSSILNTLVYDFSGSSYHYNSDYSVAGRVAVIVDPTLVTISKNFNPDPTNEGGISKLTFTLTNPNGAAVSGVSFTDTFPTTPGAMVVANPTSASMAGCGTPTFAPTAAAASISFSNGTIAANGTCTVSLNVTVPVDGVYTNTSAHLFVAGQDTGSFATDTLTVNDAPAPPACVPGLSIAQWTFPTGFSTTSPVPSSGSGTALPGTGVNSTAFTAGTASWGTNGGVTSNPTLVTTQNDYLQFQINTSGYSDVSLTFDGRRASSGNSPVGIAVYYGSAAGNPETGTSLYSNANVLTSTLTNIGGTLTFTPPAATTYVRIYFFNSGNDSPGSDAMVDNVTFTGCGIPGYPTITKSFSPDPVAVGSTSTLTFTVTNPNTSVALSGIAFSDSLPAGVTVASGGPTSVCGGSLTTTSPSTISFSGGTLASSGSCTIPVTVTATTAGPHTNVSGFISSTQSGTNTTSTGSASDTLTALTPPAISKLFSPNPILASATSTLTFTITNPNQDDALTGVAFSDPYPANLFNAATPATSTSCGGTVSAIAGLGSVSFSGGTVPAGGTCTVTVNVTSALANSYVNTSGAVTANITGGTDTASDTLDVVAPNPSIALLKQVSTGASGPWTSFLSVSIPSSVYYQFTVENTGDVPLSPISLTDNTLNVSTCNTAWTPLTLQVADALDDDHIATCVIGPVTATTGSHTNTATATGTYSGTPYTSTSSAATYASTGVTIAKSVTQTYFTTAGNVLNYSFDVTNSGSAPLLGPVTVSDDKAADESCPSVSTVGDLDNYLDPGEAVTCTATYTVLAADVTAGFVTNDAFATVSGVQSNTDDETVYVAALTIDKDTTTPSVDPNGTVVYNIVVVNTGGTDLTNFQITDAVPFAAGEYSVTNVTASGSLNENFPGYDGSGTMSLLAGTDTLGAGATATITITLQLNNATLATYDNTAIASTAETGSVDDDGLTANDPGTPVGPTTDPETDEDVTVTNSFGTLVIVKNAIPDDGQDFGYTVNGSGLSPFTLDDDAGADPTYLNTQTFNNLVAGGTYDVTETAVGGWSVTNIVCAGATSSTVTIGSDSDFDAGDNDVSVVLASGETVTCTFTNSALPAITVSKTADDTSIPETGQAVVYTVEVENTGLVDVVLDSLADDQFNDITTSGHDGITATTCATGGTISAGGTYSCTFTATLSGDFPGSHVNIVTAQVNNSGNNVSDTDDETVIFEDVLPDVTITKAANDNSVPETGQSVTFTFTVTNNSSEAATITALSDSDFTITGDADCQVGTALAAGASCDFTHTATISGNFGDADHVNTASVTVSDGDGNTDTDTEDETVTFEDVLPDIAIVKTADDNLVPESGQSVTFTFTVTNNGNESGAITALSDSDFTITGDADCQIGTVLASSASCDFTHTITISGDFGGADHVNTASVTISDNDGNTDTDTDDETVSFESVLPSVSIVKTANDNSVPETGQSVTFTFAVTNNSSEAATITALSDSDFTVTGDADCQVGTVLAAGASCDFTHTATISGDFGGTDHVNTASVTVSDDDGNTATNTDDETVTFEDVLPNISIAKTANDNSVPETGQSVTFTFVVTNNGGEPATITALSDSDFSVTGDADCQIGTILASGASCDFTHTALISGDFGGADHVNTASVTVSDDDGNTDNDTDNETVTFEDVLPDVAVTKTANPLSVPESGGPVTYTVVVTNNGGESVVLNSLTDDQFNNITTSGHDNITATTCATGSTIVSGGSYSCTFTATVSGLAGVDHVNVITAQVSDDDGNTDSATDDATVSFTGASTISDYVWDDVNGDGSQTGENGLPNVRVYVDENGNNSYDVGEPADVTDSNGNYSIGGLPAGTHDVRIDLLTLPAGYNPSYDLDGGNDNEASVTVTTGQTRADVDFGYQDQNGVIQVVKSASASVVNGGGSVTYTYAVTNPGYVSLTSISVTDDQCATVSYQNGDANTNSVLESTETWIYSCTMTLNATTTNIVTASGTDPLANSVQDTDTATVTVISSGIVKSIPAGGTSESFTSGTNVAIGEIVTYEITIDLPAGLAFDNVVVTDSMDKGLAFVECLLVDVAGTDMTSTVCPPAVSSITDPGDPAGNPANPGRQVQFTVGNIAAPVANSSLIIRYEAIVLDVIENQESVTINNNVTWAWTGGSLSTNAPNVTIVEPDMTIDKSATPTANVAIGTPIQFTLIIAHTTQSSADAFDVMVTDILPAGLEYIPCTVTYVSGLAPTTPAATYCPGPTTNLTFVWDAFPRGIGAPIPSVITFNARLDGTQPSVTNTASVAWSSLPIDPDLLSGAPVQLSTHNATSTERLYDPGDPVNIYSVDDSIAINAAAPVDPADDPDLPRALPATGYAPDVITRLPDQPVNKLYAATDVWLEIPTLGMSMPIVGVPLVDGEWNVSWLGRQAGWLNGTAYPTFDGNSVLTGHVYDANGAAGPFINLGGLKWDDRIIIHSNGYAYTYKMRENLVVKPDDVSPLKHEENAWLTLITCKTYNEATDTYLNRVAVRAELVSVEKERVLYTPSGGR